SSDRSTAEAAAIRGGLRLRGARDTSYEQETTRLKSRSGCSSSSRSAATADLSARPLARLNTAGGLADVALFPAEVFVRLTEVVEGFFKGVHHRGRSAHVDRAPAVVAPVERPGGGEAAVGFGDDEVCAQVWMCRRCCGDVVAVELVRLRRDRVVE